MRENKERNLTEALCDACIAGDSVAVRVLIENGADVNASNPYKGSPLFYACFNGHTDVVRVLLDKGARVDVVDEGKYTPLHWACWGEKVELLKLILEKTRALPASDEPDSKKQNGTPLLLVHKVPTPLHTACDALNVEMVRLLVENGVLPRKEPDGVYETFASILDIVLDKMSGRAGERSRTAEEKDATEIYLILLLNCPEDVLGALLKKPETTLRNTLLEAFQERFPELSVPAFCEEGGMAPKGP